MGIVVLAEMTEEDIAQTRMPETLDGTRALVIRQMTAALDDTHLQFISIWSLHEHVNVIIGLDNYGMRLTGKFHSLIGHASYICHYHKLISINFT